MVLFERLGLASPVEEEHHLEEPNVEPEDAASSGTFREQPNFVGPPIELQNPFIRMLLTSSGSNHASASGEQQHEQIASGKGAGKTRRVRGQFQIPQSQGTVRTIGRNVYERVDPVPETVISPTQAWSVPDLGAPDTQDLTPPELRGAVVAVDPDMGYEFCAIAGANQGDFPDQLVKTLQDIRAAKTQKELRLVLHTPDLFEGMANEAALYDLVMAELRKIMAEVMWHTLGS